MSRRNRLFIWLTGIIILLVLSYAGLPRVLAVLVKQQLSALGLSAIRFKIDYPGWRGIRLHSLAFTTMAGNQQVACKVPEVEIEYHLTELVTGTVARIRVPLIAVRIKSPPGRTPTGPISAPIPASTSASTSASAALPLAGLLAGKWLADIPVRELLLKQLKVHGHTSAGAVYTLQLSGQLRNAQLQANAELHLPLPQKPIALSLKASHTGETHLSVSSPDKTAQPMLTFAVNPLVIDQDTIERKPIKLNGVITARLNSLMPMLAAGLNGTDRVAGLEGELNSQWQALVSETNWRISGELAVQGFGGRWGEQALPLVNLTTRFDVNPRQINFTPVLDAVDKAVVLEASGRYQFSDGNIQAEFRLQPVSFNESGFVLSQLLENWPYPFDIIRGQLRLDGKLNWQKKLAIEGRLHLDRLGGHYKEIAFAGLSSKLELAKDDGIQTTRDAQLQVDLVDAGFPIEKLNAGFALLARPKAVLPALDLKKFSAELLGGRVRLTPFIFDMERDRNAFVVQLEQVSLNKVMALEKQQGLEGTGILDGRIPIEFSAKGLLVKQGWLAARTPGGVIRYTPDEKVAAMAQSNTSVDIVVKALSNFHYQVLNMKSDYQRGGDLLLKIQLQGGNPDWQAGLPIHLNLNLQENIPALLRSLQLSDDISERMRKHFAGTPPDNDNK